MTDEADRWHKLASRLGIKVTAPAIVAICGESITFTALLPQFGAKMGMIADPDWGVISPHAVSLGDLGYGFSAVSLGGDMDDDESAKEMMRDWGWSATEPEPSWW